MKARIRTALEHELLSAQEAERQGDIGNAWFHLERAHVLSQAYAWPHVRVHARMLAFGLRRRDLRELLGQLIRVAVAAPASWLGAAPLGNTGGVNVGLRTPMAIPEDLRRMLAD